jgi:spermidine synthase
MYHEALVQPAMCAHPQPLRVFIGGGGEGATLREVMKHASVTRATMCDIDEEVVELCKQHLPTHHKGSFDDARAELVFTDAKAYVETHGPWDVIILDLADPLECGPAFALYTQEFYRTCFDKLTPHGIFVTQAGACDLTTCRDVYTPVYATLRSVFPHVFPYGIYIPSFGHEWGFIVVRARALHRYTRRALLSATAPSTPSSSGVQTPRRGSAHLFRRCRNRCLCRP